MQELEIIGQGATATVYRDRDKAIKIYKNARFEWVTDEAEHQRFAYDAGLPVPEVFGVRKIDENTVAFDAQYINGRPLLYSGMEKQDRHSAISTLAKLQCEVHKVNAAGLPKYSDKLKARINSTQYLEDMQKSDLLSLLARLDNGCENLCHADFHPLNVLYDGQKCWIIDWVDACAGDPLADACRTYLIFKQHLYRSAGIYLRAFCKETNSKGDDVLAWLPVIAAARLSENMDDKARAWLLSLISI